MSGAIRPRMRLVLLLACLFFTASAHAQRLPVALMMRPSTLETVDPTLRLRPLDAGLYEDQEEDAEQRRQRYLFAIGTGAMLSAGLHAAILGSMGGCDKATRGALLGGGLVGAVGLGFALGGGVPMARVPPEKWQRASRGQKAALFLTSFAVFAVTQAALSMRYASNTCS